MEITLKILENAKELHEAWQQMADFVEESEEGNYYRPWAEYDKENKIGYYTTCTGKGEYTLKGDTLIFCGYRNSFGNADYLWIREENGKLILTIKYDWNDGKYCEISVPLEVVEFKTSMPEKPLWAIDYSGKTAMVVKWG